MKVNCLPLLKGLINSLALLPVLVMANNTSTVTPKAIYFNKAIVSPQCLLPLLPAMEDSSINTALIDLGQCQRRNQHALVTVNSIGSVMTQTKDGGFIGYALQGTMQNSLQIIDFFENGGGSGTFETLLLVQTLPLQVMTPDFSTSNNTLASNFTYLKLAGVIPIGDRCLGGLKQVTIAKNILTIEQYNGQNAADCTKTVSHKIDVTKWIRPTV